MKKFIKSNIKVVVAFIMGAILFGGSAYVLATTIASSSVEYTENGQTTVEGALTDLYQKADKCIMPLNVNVGDYISLTPDKTSYVISHLLTGESDQTINPSELNLWRVIDIHSDGLVDMVSEYASSTNVNFKGTTGYANLVGALNIIAAQYQKAGYTINARCMGYDGQTEYITDTSAFDGSTNTAPGTTTTPSLKSGTGEEYSGGVLGDTLYLKDYLLVKNVYKSVKTYQVGTTTEANYWLASRLFVYSKDTYFNFRGFYVNVNGDLGNNSMFRHFGNSWVDYSNGKALRPILTLKSGITISGGSGTKDSPYTLS